MTKLASAEYRLESVRTTFAVAPGARLAARLAVSFRLESKRLAAALRRLDGGRIVVLPLARLEEAAS